MLAVVEATVLTIAIGAVLHRYERWALLLGAAGWLAALAALSAARPTTWDGARSTYRAGIRAVRGLRWWQVVIVGMAALAVAWRVVLAAVLPPFAFDALVYHLTVVADWVQGGSVGVNHYVHCCSHYPSGAETLFAWPALFLHDDALVDAVQIALALMAAVAVAGLARWLGLGESSALTAAAVFLLTPIVLTQANTSYNDVAVVAFLLSAAYFTVRLLDAGCFRLGHGDEPGPSYAHALLAGSATGLALGAKTNGILIAFVLTVLVLAHVALAVRHDRALWRALLGTAAIFVGAVILVGGWWYGRNWILTGNPVWPFRVGVAGTDVFSGPATVDEYLTVPPGGAVSWPLEIARSWYHDLVFWTRRDYSYEERDGGLGPLWSWLGWIAVGALAFRAVAHRRDAAVNLLMPLLLVFLLLPYKWWSRFTIFLAAIGAIAVVALLDRLRPGLRRKALTAVVLVLLLAGAARATWQLDPGGRGSKLTVPDVLGLVGRPPRERGVGALFFPEYAFLSRVPEHATIAVEREASSLRFPYPFFGDGLRRTVQLLLPGDERRLGTSRSAMSADFVVVGAGSAFDSWLVGHPAAYVRIVDEHGVRVYRAAAR